MALLQLKLYDVQNDNIDTTASFELVEYSNQTFYVYASDGFKILADSTTWRFDLMDVASDPVAVTPAANPAYFYFHLAFDEDRGASVVINDPGTSGYDEMEYIIQCRMDTGTVVIEDGNNILLEFHADKLLDDPTVNTNVNGCCTLTLPDVQALPKSAEPQNNMVYLLAYDNGDGKTMVQGAICTKNDNRFHAYVGEEERVVVRRFGLELYTSEEADDSLTNAINHPVLIYGFKVSELSELPERFHRLFFEK